MIREDRVTRRVEDLPRRPLLHQVRETRLALMEDGTLVGVTAWLGRRLIERVEQEAGCRRFPHF